MFPDDYMAWLIRQEQNKDLVREAERDRLGRMANPVRPELLDRVLASVGGLMIAAGKKLQARHMPVRTGLTVSQ
jgi:hypothetical protein